MRLQAIKSQKKVIFMNMPFAYSYKTSKSETLHNSCNALVPHTEELLAPDRNSRNTPVGSPRPLFQYAYFQLTCLSAGLVFLLTY